MAGVAGISGYGLNQPALGATTTVGRSRGSVTRMKTPEEQAAYNRRYADQGAGVVSGPVTVTNRAVTIFDELLAKLHGGGTDSQKAFEAARLEEINRNRAQQGKYSKEAAMSDSQALVQKAINDALRSAMPQITQASEGAGASKSTLRAQLTQEAATRGALEGAAQGAQLSTAYGQQYNQLASVLESLTRQDPNSPTALLAQAITSSKGMVQPQQENPIVSTSTYTGPDSQVAPVQNQAATNPVPALNPFSSNIDPYGSFSDFYDPTPKQSPVVTSGRGSGGIIVSNPNEYEADSFSNAWDF